MLMTVVRAVAAGAFEIGHRPGRATRPGHGRHGKDQAVTPIAVSAIIAQLVMVAVTLLAPYLIIKRQ